MVKQTSESAKCTVIIIFLSVWQLNVWRFRGQQQLPRVYDQSDGPTQMDVPGQLILWDMGNKLEMVLINVVCASKYETEYKFDHDGHITNVVFSAVTFREFECSSFIMLENQFVCDCPVIWYF